MDDLSCAPQLSVAFKVALMQMSCVSKIWNSTSFLSLNEKRLFSLSRNTLGMEQREIAGFTDKPMYMSRVEHYYLAGSSRPIEHAELGLQAYHTPSLPGQQPETKWFIQQIVQPPQQPCWIWSTKRPLSHATRLKLPLQMFLTCKGSLNTWALCPILACYLARVSSLWGDPRIVKPCLFHTAILTNYISAWGKGYHLHPVILQHLTDISASIVSLWDRKSVIWISKC